VEAAFFGDLREQGVCFEEHRSGKDVAYEADGEEGFYAAGAAGDDAYGSGGCDGVDGGVSAGSFLGVDGVVEVREGAAFGGECGGGLE